MERNVGVGMGSGSLMSRGTVSIVQRDGVVIVTVDGQSFDCDVLSTDASGGLAVSEGDDVLVWLPESAEESGVIIGRVARRTMRAELIDEGATDPDELVISARRSLTLKVGDGSITIREDGRILIKGKDLVSHAKRMNRIRGGSVQIN